MRRRRWSSSSISSSSFPAILALVFAGWKYASRSWRYHEVSINSPAGIPVYQFKTVIVVAGVLLFIQGIAQVMRCLICLKRARWPPTPRDVEELEKLLVERKSLDILARQRGGRRAPSGPTRTATERPQRGGCTMTGAEVALLQLGILVFAIMLGFPVAYTLMALGVGFGYYAYHDPALFERVYLRLLGEDTGTLWSIWAYIRALFSNRIFDLFVNQTYSVMSNDVLTAIPLFLFMGYIVERAEHRQPAVPHAADRRRGTCRARLPWRRSSPARSSPPPPASSAPWSR